MKKEHFTKIIKLIKPTFTNVDFKEVWYKRFFYVVTFNTKGQDYKLYLDLVQDWAFIRNIQDETEIGSVTIENKKFLKILQSV